MHRALLRFHRLHRVRLLAFAACLTAMSAAKSLAQDAQTPPAPANSTSSATDANAANLFPNGAYTPAPELEENRAAAGPGQGRRGGGRRNRAGGPVGRANDVMSARAASDPLEVRIAFRKAKTQALLLHPELSVLEQQAASAPTDVDKRAYLRQYYTQLYSAVRKIDPSPAMKTHVDLLSGIAQQRYDPKRRVVGGDEDLVRGGHGGRGRRR